MRDPARLQRLLRIRNRLCDMRRAELAVAKERERQAQAQLERDRAMEHARGEALRSRGDREATELLSDVDLLTRATAAAQRSSDVVVEKQGEVSERSEAVAVARRDVKALERVNERLMIPAGPFALEKCLLHE